MAESVFAAARTQVLAAYRGQTHKAAGGADEDDQDELDDALDAIDYSPLQEAAGAQAKKVAADAARLGLEQVTDPLERMLSQANARAVEWAGERAGQLIKGVSDTTRSRVRAVVAAGLDAGKTNADIADELEDSDAFSTGRAETIARTETAAADITGNIIGWQESGVVAGKEWIVADANECDLCQAFEGKVVPLDDEFEDGDPPLHPNCRCDVLPVLSEDEDAEKLLKYPGQPRNALGQFDSGGGGAGGDGASGSDGGKEKPEHPPWRKDPDAKGPGKVIGKPDKTVTDDEKKMIEKMVNESGKNFAWANQTGNARIPEGWLSHEATPTRSKANSVEAKVLSASADVARTCRTAVIDSLRKGGQSPNIDINAGDTGMTKKQANEVAAALKNRHVGPNDGPLWHLRIYSDKTGLNESYSF